MNQSTIELAAAAAAAVLGVGAAVLAGRRQPFSVPAPAVPLPRSPRPSSSGQKLGPTLRQAEVTPEMTGWAKEVLRDKNQPIGAIVGPRDFQGMPVLAHVEIHPADPPIGPPYPHRGVGLYHLPKTPDTFTDQ